MELWKDIPGYEGRYQVSDQGRVKSLKGTHKLLRPGLRSGYPSVILHQHGVGKNFQVKRLVLLAFVGPPPPDAPQALHRFPDKADCRLSSLRWGTAAENGADKVRDGNSTQGEKHHKAKLKEYQVLAIRSDERSAIHIARDYGVCPGTIHHIKVGTSWRHLPSGGV